ncbi:MAG TPA: MmgE/PrpD family protein, partial [Candidatus Udaeobacter sp.]|nr:MmgE/PrpD family protein [Candidatus Udaeobacter sp.]
MNERLHVTEQLGAYIAGNRAEQLPPPVAERAKFYILDSIGAIVSGSLLKPGKLIIDFVRAQGGMPEASMLAT